MANHQSMVNHKLSHSLQPIPSPAAPRRAIARRSWSDRCLPWRLTVPCSSGSSNSKWMVYNGKNRKKWMITRSTPIFYGNLQINVKSKYIENQQNRCISTLMGLTFPHFFGVNQENSVCTNKMWKCQPQYNYEIVIPKWGTPKFCYWRKPLVLWISGQTCKQVIIYTHMSMRMTYINQ